MASHAINMSGVLTYHRELTFHAGTVNLAGYERNETLETSQTCRQLCHPGNAGDLGPGLKRLGPGSSILLS